MPISFLELCTEHLDAARTVLSLLGPRDLAALSLSSRATCASISALPEAVWSAAARTAYSGSHPVLQAPTVHAYLRR